MGHVKLYVHRDPGCCAWTYFDVEDMHRLAPYLLHGLKREDRLQPYLNGGTGYGRRRYWSIGRMLLGVDDPKYKIRYLNGNCFDNRKSNLAVCKIGQSPLLPYGPGWLTMRRRAWTRSGGICERYRRQPGTSVHHIIPAKFFRRPSDAHFLPNLLVVCEDCHRIEHREMISRMPLFYGATLPAIRPDSKLCACNVHSVPAYAIDAR
jgi:hypothetical protein